MGLLGRMLRNVHAGDTHLAWARLVGPDSITLTSPDFEPGGVIPRAHAAEGVGANTSPELAWTGVPAQTAALLVVMEDPTVPLPRPILHVAAVIAPILDRIPLGMLDHDSPGITLLDGSIKGLGYSGPRPIVDHGPHDYVFQIFALDRVPVSLRDPGTVLGRGRLTGTFERTSA
ncbi:YbhB/YbcL family Raf kinase inhibitor-like protein [Glaciihabitans arcticus]|uniref:YbhB/YbcL family Raf kinase inhibitor-like protein n=1 Tax=Glaciihabitans arcticus TaxID=2668039 RepID=A0A4Q9GXQ9_9MICO|nr:YbhB/YbcL family Raf kinase inhibitor-like protein [Glaciihabitans arcticus]TBN57543.1 YbhB/YbcL family Raf kinase inhibitor-like protein [Glaciihabitans arcticus]